MCCFGTLQMHVIYLIYAILFHTIANPQMLHHLNMQKLLAAHVLAERFGVHNVP
jgi:hypothetical protein